MMSALDAFLTQHRDRIIGTVDTSYTGEHGLHETIERGEDLLKEADVVREKQILQKFFTELQKPHGLVAYGLNEVLNALKAGAVDMLIVSENIDSVTGRENFLEELEEEVKNYGTNLEVVSADTREGMQFEELGGIGAILRYNLTS